MHSLDVFFNLACFDGVVALSRHLEVVDVDPGILPLSKCFLLLDVLWIVDVLHHLAEVKHHLRIAGQISLHIVWVKIQVDFMVLQQVGEGNLEQLRFGKHLVGVLNLSEVDSSRHGIVLPHISILYILDFHVLVQVDESSPLEDNTQFIVHWHNGHSDSNSTRHEWLLVLLQLNLHILGVVVGLGLVDEAVLGLSLGKSIVDKRQEGASVIEEMG